MSDTPIAEHVVNVIRREMTNRGLSQGALCRAASFERSQMSRRLSGVSPFSLNELERIAAALDTTVAALCTYPSDKTNCEPAA